MRNPLIRPEIFTANRKRFIKAMDRNSIAIFNSNDELPMNGDALYRFKQNADLYWLTGILQEDSMVILFPDHPDPKMREVLVLVRPNELKEKWMASACVAMRPRPSPASRPSFGWIHWTVCSSP